MTKIRNTIKVNNNTYRRLNKTTANKLFDRGEIIMLCPCKMNLHSPWAILAEITKTGDRIFDSLVNDFVYYNCSNELGQYPHYYIKL